MKVDLSQAKRPGPGRPARKNPNAKKPVRYNIRDIPRIKRLCLLGYTNQQLADVLGVTKETFNTWTTRFPELAEALTESRDEADAKVAESLYKRAVGYSHPEDKFFVIDGEVHVEETTKHYPPDVGAADKWLNTKRGDYWKPNKDDADNTVEIVIKDMREDRGIIDVTPSTEDE